MWRQVVSLGKTFFCCVHTQAIKARKHKLVDLLLKQETIDIDVQSKRGFTALMLSAWKGEEKIGKRAHERLIGRDLGWD